MHSGDAPGQRVEFGTFGSAILSVAFTALIVLSILRAFDWNPASFLHLGGELPEIAGYVEERLPDVPVFLHKGHDGKYFFVQAHDPLLLDPTHHAAIMDRPAYRYQRILYPTLASPALAFGDGGLVWALIVLNLVAVGLGSWASGALATRFGASGWWGLVFGLNPGVLFEVFVDGAGVIALAGAVLGLVAVVDGRRWSAALLFAAAALAREVMLVVPLGVALWRWQSERKIDWRETLLPFGAVGIWTVYIRLRLGVSLVSGQTQELGAPLLGFVAAVSRWVRTPGADLLAGLALLAIVIVTVRRLRVSTSLVTYGVGGFAILSIFLTEQVWLHYFDATRALAPLITGFALGVATDRGARADNSRPSVGLGDGREFDEE